jgi:flagellar basal-body rod modification protein FlgD
MDVSSTIGLGNATAARTTARTDKSQMDYDAFLQLLIAEMQHQDPTEPMKSSEYMAQFASFSSVEQAIKTNAKLDTLLTNSALSQVDALLGKTVASPDGKISGKVESLRVTTNGLIAVLEGGKELAIGPGIKIS